MMTPVFVILVVALADVSLVPPRTLFRVWRFHSRNAAHTPDCGIGGSSAANARGDG